MHDKQDDRAFSERVTKNAVMPILQGIWNELFMLRVATKEEDQQQATDLVVGFDPLMEVFVTDGLRSLGVRVRRPGYLDHRDEFTIRSYRESGAKTELAKILEGWGKAMFYCHTNDREEIVLWHIINLDAFRYLYVNRNYTGREIPNPDNETWFRAFCIPTCQASPRLLEMSSDKLLLARTRGRERTDTWLFPIHPVRC